MPILWNPRGICHETNWCLLWRLGAIQGWSLSYFVTFISYNHSGSKKTFFLRGAEDIQATYLPYEEVASCSLKLALAVKNLSTIQTSIATSVSQLRKKRSVLPLKRERRNGIRATTKREIPNTPASMHRLIGSDYQKPRCKMLVIAAKIAALFLLRCITWSPFRRKAAGSAGLIGATWRLSAWTATTKRMAASLRERRIGSGGNCLLRD